jgi:TonB dependent receptor
LFSAPYGQVDLSSSVKLSEIYDKELPSDPSLTLDIENLTKSKIVTYDEYPNAIHSYYAPGMVLMFGIRGTF